MILQRVLRSARPERYAGSLERLTRLTQRRQWTLPLRQSRGFSSESDAAAAENKEPPSQPSEHSASDAVAQPPSIVQRVPFRELVLPCIPLYRRPLFPGIVAPILVQDSAACEAFLAMKDGGNRFAGLFLHKSAGQGRQQGGGEAPGGITALPADGLLRGAPDPDQLFKVGVIGELLRMAPRPKGLELTYMCHHRIRATGVARREALLFLHTEPVQEEKVEQTTSIRAYSLAVVETLRELLSAGSLYKEQLELLLESVDVNNPYHLADLGACLASTADAAALQEILEEPRLEERLSKTLGLLKSELETIRVQRKISRQIEENVSNAQRKFFLNEQLKYIRKELGLEKDERESVKSKLLARLEQKQVPKQAASVIDEEMQKLSALDPASSEYNVTRNYLDWLTIIPWGVYSQDNLDIQNVRAVLDEDHYGMDDVKKRIQEFIAIGKLKGTVEGKILLLSGPPGVGKTTIGKSIARALGRKCYRFSVGGMSDVAEIKGHRRTYVGAMPGKFIQALKVAQTQNPLILIDEIDKLGRGWQGDPSSALLEALDPEQNNAFLDHYLDVPVDLSKTLFICTANVIDSIPSPLLDRMENISLPGYILEEKVAIARRHLVPQARKAAGLTARQLVIREGALRALARDYCREAGVRSLQKQIERICRKVALQIVNQDIGQMVVNSESLPELVGKPPYASELAYRRMPSGVARGLAWTPLGGAVLYVESIDTGHQGSGGAFTGGPRLHTTGQIGSVMKESSDIALSFARRFLQAKDPANRFFERAYIHMHVPEGATPKDGPSAGCTMVTSLLSLALNRPVPSDLAMTGEMTLTGRILPVGGIREKVVAAKRAGLKRVLLPQQNIRDWEELPDYIRRGLEVSFVSSYDDVYRIAFASAGAGASAGASGPADANADDARETTAVA
ncbi:probable ATP-dependent protease Lon [Cyanidioschyzon merolae strain 10D]|jgi:Lon-like ATP-dependent protease|uniref:Lon protease homolog n=1 Tax=Cyanidioschyzon merolae (strain NIES-3377 / 10D) TaxID=280699 RepID=M1VG25_CYAM1|nr:probable ATP-dependent protease Lon [Cyanidioschyzon merolae strain 10D]BAM82012.1 probable ATP-dependent protease Lon [Cyanidioschyzon merolae strain 10D]|eukprot:XP_005538048.1 probable ATP-dependent protease Lon [Cyanidioschyzon merolae strain 10D]